MPLIGNTFAMARDPARFFADCYRKYGPAFHVSMMGRRYTTIAGTEAANFMETREGRECLRSKEFWQGLVEEYGATRPITDEDGEMHDRLRAVMKHGYSRESLEGRYNELLDITDAAIARN